MRMLRTDVKFSDGTPFNAAAVKVNFDRIADPATKSQLAASLLGPYTGTQILGPYTVKVNFSKPFAPFLQAASTPELGFYSPKTIAANGASLGSGGPVDVGTGPFIVASYTRGQSLVLKRNPAYHWGPATSSYTGPARLSTLTFRFRPEASVRVGALTSGQVDLASAIPAADVKTVAATSGLRVAQGDIPGGNYNIYLNSSLAPLTDERVRKAIQLGVNVAVDVQTVYFGVYPRAWSPLSPATPDYTNALDNGLQYNSAEAGNLLNQAGWTTRNAAGYRTKDGKQLTLVARSDIVDTEGRRPQTHRLSRGAARGGDPRLHSAPARPGQPGGHAAWPQYRGVAGGPAADNDRLRLQPARGALSNLTRARSGSSANRGAAWRSGTAGRSAAGSR